MITVTRRVPWPGYTRYQLSNGWFIDGAQTTAHRHGRDKYTLWQPGGDPSGCAAPRGGAPTLKLALAIANGGQPCSRAEWGCRNVAVGYTVHGPGRVYHCADHAG